MHNAIRRSLGLYLARWQFRKKHDSVMSFTSSLSSGQRVLVVLPLSPSEPPSGAILELFRTRYGEERVTLVAGTADTRVGTLFPHSEIIRISGEEVTRLFHPTADVLKHITNRTYDAAIDLNLDFLLPSGYICKASNARVRVGFTRPGADHFYNFQIHIEGSHNTTLYDRLAACLKMF